MHVIIRTAVWCKILMVEKICRIRVGKNLMSKKLMNANVFIYRHLDRHPYRARTLINFIIVSYTYLQLFNS